MLNLSSANNRKIKHLYVEKIDLEIHNQEQKPKLPRHISSLENKSYYQSAHCLQASQIPNKCSLNPDSSGADRINLAVDILKYQLKDRASQQKHLKNLRDNIRHRLKVANAKGNRELADVLQKEFKELAINS
ncbi:MAG: hypothetical protein AAGF83_20345 [Cyanobacteria bacterium P01_G01_bin.67]